MRTDKYVMGITKAVKQFVFLGRESLYPRQLSGLKIDTLLKRKMPLIFIERHYIFRCFLLGVDYSLPTTKPLSTTGKTIPLVDK